VKVVGERDIFVLYHGISIGCKIKRDVKAAHGGKVALTYLHYDLCSSCRSWRNVDDIVSPEPSLLAHQLSPNFAGGSSNATKSIATLPCSPS